MNIHKRSLRAQKARILREKKHSPKYSGRYVKNVMASAHYGIIRTPKRYSLPEVAVIIFFLTMLAFYPMVYFLREEFEIYHVLLAGIFAFFTAFLLRQRNKNATILHLDEILISEFHRNHPLYSGYLLRIQAYMKKITQPSLEEEHYILSLSQKHIPQLLMAFEGVSDDAQAQKNLCEALEIIEKKLEHIHQSAKDGFAHQLKVKKRFIKDNM